MAEHIPMSQKIDWGFKILSVAIIPLLVWVNSVSVETALLKEKVSSHDRHLDRVKERMVEVRLNAQALQQIKADLQETSRMLEEIKSILIQRNQLGGRDGQR